MPQMSPLNWMSLFITFTIIFIMFNVMNYFSFKYQPIKKKTTNLNSIKINWKW
uniref:ATP synthase complex subunit 8 n=1 Tax=Staphylinidae sp. BMNH 1274642 TaxID=1796583 RepID=A0A126TFU4_9COLE|nr:ATP synthase F0 subunit 8 [Staphylinidae sp. BMNH 1274642]